MYFSATSVPGRPAIAGQSRGET